ncbi:hypothetical protein ACFROC_05615 [Nocardia tengchongensis]|uniref:hypothetical protein n=1 Tax=Nocardia tengchongensis TaxID=2055889 RepID=UPI00369EE610
MLNQNTRAVAPGRPEIGGIYFLGQCGECNSASGARFDPAYGALADALRPLWIASLQQSAPTMMELPSVTIAPAAVARAIILGMCATTPMIRKNWPQVEQLCDPNQSNTLPPEWRLCLALTRGKTAWVAGTSAGTYIHGPRVRRTAQGGPQIMMSMASVYFPPLAWQLVTEGSELLTDNGWADVSDWLTFPPTAIHDLHQLVPRLPMVKHPRHEPNGDHDWVDFIQTDVSAVAECFDVTNKDSDDAQARNRLIQRRMIPMDDVEEVARRRGVMP